MKSQRSKECIQDTAEAQFFSGSLGLETNYSPNHNANATKKESHNPSF